MKKYIIRKGNDELYYIGKSEYRNVITGKSYGSGIYKIPLFSERGKAKKYRTIVMARFVAKILNNIPFPKLTKLKVVIEFLN